jgi:hypothetical protein
MDLFSGGFDTLTIPCTYSVSGQYLTLSGAGKEPLLLRYDSVADILEYAESPYRTFRRMPASEPDKAGFPARGEPRPTHTAATAAAIPAPADISVSGIFLHDRASQDQTLGANISFDHDASIPNAVFPSADGHQFLTVFTHPGGGGEIAEFRISYSVNEKRLAHRIEKVERFVSGKGIRLGLAKSRVISILGAPLQQHDEDGIVTLEYRLEETEQVASEFLSHYNMPIYYGSYSFKNDRLIEFQFGFEYP